MLRGLITVMVTLAQLNPVYALVQDGKSDYVIVLPARAIASEKRAARELQEVLQQMTGARLPISSDGVKMPAKAILLGTNETNRLVRELQTTVTGTTLGEEGYSIETKGPHIILGGGRPRGTLYAVYSFLEAELGCRWFSEHVSRIPRVKTISLPPIHRTELPAFEYREPFYTEAWEKNWAVRNRCNGTWMKLDEDEGGRIGYHPWAHSFEELVEPKKYGISHPEYFSEVNGKRTTQTAQLCLTNPDVKRIAVEQVLKWIRRNPEAKMISVSQNDWGGPCMCVECKKIFEQEGAHSGQLLTFVNHVADAIAHKHPDKLIDTLAYQYTEKPPAHITPAKNVRVRLAPINNCFAHPTDTCPENKTAYENLVAWSRITKNLYIWHYNTNFSNYPMPFPDFDELQGSTRAYHKLGVKGIFFQGAFAKGGGGELAELRSWVLAKLLWDPSRDVWKLMAEFADGYYGKAAPQIMQYLTMMHSAVRDEGIHFRIYDAPGKVGYLRRDLVDRAEKLFEEAEAAVSSEPAVLARVQKARFSIDYVRLKQAKDPVERERYATIVRDKIGRYGITEVSERQPVAKFLDTLGKKPKEKKKRNK